MVRHVADVQIAENTCCSSRGPGLGSSVYFWGVSQNLLCLRQIVDYVDYKLGTDWFNQRMVLGTMSGHRNLLCDGKNAQWLERSLII